MGAIIFVPVPGEGSDMDQPHSRCRQGQGGVQTKQIWAVSLNNVKASGSVAEESGLQDSKRRASVSSLHAVNSAKTRPNSKSQIPILSFQLTLLRSQGISKI